MNLLPQFLTASSLVLTLAFLAVLISGICIYQALRVTIQTKKSQVKLESVEKKLTCLVQNSIINNILNLALFNSCQTKNNIELCNILLNDCIHKSDILTAKAIENSLHSEINNAVSAIKTLEEKRTFLETKIKEAFETVNQKTQTSELEPCLPYAQVLLEESSLEFASTEQMKKDVLQVNQVLASVLLKL